MSSLRERIGGLVAKWRERRVRMRDLSEHNRAAIYGQCADELAALAAEGQGYARPNVQGASPVCLDCNKAGLRNCSHFDNCDGTWVYKPTAAAPSLHKEPPRDEQERDYGAQMYQRGRREMRDEAALAALHKEGAGGAPRLIAGASSLEREAAASVALDTGEGGTRRACNNPDCANDWPCPVHGEKLPLQRTLPDEQFKGAVVEPIVVEKAQVELGQELSDSIGLYALALESGGDEEIGIAIKRCVAAKRAWDAAASPAGRAEQVSGSTGAAKDGDASAE